MIVLLLSIFITLLVGSFTFLLFGVHLLIAVNLGLSVLFALFINLRYQTHQQRRAKTEFLFSFIELFILNYDIQKSVDGVLTVLYPLLDPKAQKLFAKVRKNHDGMNLLNELRTYFSHHYYESFLDIVTVISERGGDIIKVSEVLLYSISQSEGRMTKLGRIDTTYLVKFTFSWLFIMVVAVVFRFALDGFMNFTNFPLIYIAGQELFLAMMLFSFILVIENTVRSGKRDY